MERVRPVEEAVPKTVVPPSRDRGCKSLTLRHSPFRSSRAERSADNRQTAERYRAEGPAFVPPERAYGLARQFGSEALVVTSAPLKPGRARRNSVTSHQFPANCKLRIADHESRPPAFCNPQFPIRVSRFPTFPW